MASWKEIQERVEWGVLVLFGGGLTLSIVMKDSGASKIMADSIVQFVQTKPLWVLCFVITAFIIFLTEFTSKITKFKSYKKGRNHSPFKFSLKLTALY